VKKYLVLLLVLLLINSVSAQKVTRVELLQSESFIGMKRNGENTQKVIKPVFKQDNATLICDSAYFYIEKNSFDAFGHVHINQADTVNIYSDLLNYNGNTKIAVLTNNVRMVDKGAVLTTNHLVYNMASKVGQYTNGGKIISGMNTLTSTNGYYFSNSADAYFRYNVRVKSPDALILSDTLRYNSISKIAYFYGPTNIYGKDDTLYTENGQYNTATDQAAFGKRNLYTQNSKSLKGDSLFYDRNAGYGRAVRNILFKDTAQKVELRGDLGVYQKKDESITVTQNAYVVLVSEKDSVSQDSIWMAADTLYSKVFTKGELYKLRQSRIAVVDSAATAEDNPQMEAPVETIDSVATDSLNIVKDALADSLTITAVQDSIPPVEKEEIKPPLSKKELKKAEKQRKKAQKEAEAALPSSAAKENKKTEKAAAVAQVDSTEIKALNRRFFVIDSLMKDSIRTLEQDTAKVRIISAWRKVKVFKSDLQSKSDSAFFSYGDSTLRIYQSPMLWAQGSQMSADTMYIQMKNKKMDNMDMIRNAIVVNTKPDSLYFNQVAGKLMKGYFVNEKLDRIFVNGNAESIYFPEDSTEAGSMLRTIAARMRINFSNDSLMSVLFIRKPEMTYYPLPQLTEELKTLPNFSWKPKDRPKSREDVIAKRVEPKNTKAPKKEAPKVPAKTIIPKVPEKKNVPVTKKIGAGLGTTK
jgi:lipopolysaccharide export system protein LptA